MAHNCLTVATFQGAKVQVETDLYSTVNNNYMQYLTQDFRRLWSVDYNPHHSLVKCMGNTVCVLGDYSFKMGFESK